MARRTKGPEKSWLSDKIAEYCRPLADNVPPRPSSCLSGPQIILQTRPGRYRSGRLVCNPIGYKPCPVPRRNPFRCQPFRYVGGRCDSGPWGAAKASLLAPPPPPRARETTQCCSTSSYEMQLCRSRPALVLPYSIVPSRPSLPPRLTTGLRRVRPSTESLMIIRRSCHTNNTLGGS